MVGLSLQANRRALQIDGDQFVLDDSGNVIFFTASHDRELTDGMLTVVLLTDDSVYTVELEKVACGFCPLRKVDCIHNDLANVAKWKTYMQAMLRQAQTRSKAAL